MNLWKNLTFKFVELNFYYKIKKEVVEDAVVI